MKKIVSYLFLLLSLAVNSLAFASSPTVLEVIEKKLLVNGRESKVFDIVQPDGTFGYVGTKGQDFNVVVKNKTQVPLVLHWHGIVDPNDQDGVPYVTQLPILPGKTYHYQFKLKQAGTYWLHSHYQLQEQKLMAAPLIIRDPNEAPENEALMFIQDFSFENPVKIYETLRNNLQKNTMQMKHGMAGHADVSDVKFDAYLTNHRTLQNPDIVRITPNSTLRLRIINASASSNYYIDLGTLKGSLFVIDGEAIKPITGSRFQIAIGNRLDIRIHIPAGEGAYPILALPEGTKQQTGLILATAKANIPKLSEQTSQANPILDYSQEMKTSATEPLPPRAIQQSFPYVLNGDMANYRWTLNGQEWPFITPYLVKANQMTEFVFINKSEMAHPMHLHGHVFQIKEINGKPIQGRKGDTVNVLPKSSVKVVLETTNPGIWMLHCHILYHQMGGMMTTFNYQNYPNRFNTKERLKGENLYNLSI